MDIEKIEQVACDSMAGRKELREREPGWLYYHGRRTAKIAMWLCEELDLNVDRDAVYAGALFHDIGKGSESHNEIGVAITRELLNDLCTSGELDIICDIVRNHNQREHSSSWSVAVRIVQDADLIDHVGPIVPWLAFYWSGTHNETIHDHIRFVRGEENERYRKRMREGLSFDVSRRIFDERVDFEEQFFAQFHRVYMEGI